MLSETTSRGLCGCLLITHIKVSHSDPINMGGVSFMCVCFITAGPITKLFVWGGGGEWRTCAMRDDEPRPVWMSLLITHSVVNAGGREIL